MKAIIPCAGESSRFNGKCKALVNLGGQTVIERMVKQINPHVNKIIIVSDSQNKNKFYEKFKNNSKISIIIDDAYSVTGGVIEKVMVKSKDNHDILIVWGDIVYKSKKFIKDFIRKCCENPKYDMYIAVQFEEKPYLAILLDNKGISKDVFFSRQKGYRVASGYHDLGTFIIKYDVLKYLKMVKLTSNGEKRFLDLVNILYKNKKGVKLCEFFNSPILSFNTPPELKKTLKFLKIKL